MSFPAHYRLTRTRTSEVATEPDWVIVRWRCGKWGFPAAWLHRVGGQAFTAPNLPTLLPNVSPFQFYTYFTDPDGIRTRVASVKGWCPGPLDDGAVPARHGAAHQHDK